MTNVCIPVSPAIRSLKRDRSGGVFALAILACALAAPVASAQLAVYTDSLQNGFTDWSWGTRNLAQSAVVHSGTAAISFEPDSWAGLFLHRDAGFAGTDYEAIELWVRGAGAGGQQLTVAILIGGSPAGSAALAGFVEGGSVPAGTWAKATVPFSALGLSTGSWDGLWLQDSSGGTRRRSTSTTSDCWRARGRLPRRPSAGR